MPPPPVSIIILFVPLRAILSVPLPFVLVAIFRLVLQGFLHVGFMGLIA
jgi:hypothetical protein